MNEKTREDLSALVDGEVGTHEATSLLERVERESALRTAWERYHLIGDVLRNGIPDVGMHDLVERVRKLVDSEPLSLTRRRRRVGPVKAMGGLALAASVAIVAIVGVQLVNRELPPAPAQIAEAEVTDPADEPVQFAGARWDVEHPAVEARLNRYLVDHSEYLDNGMWGVLPYARIVSYDDGN